MMFPTATYVVSVLVIVFFPPSDFTQYGCHKESSSSSRRLSPFFGDIAVPPLDPSKYMADQDREPFRILFVLMKSVSKEMREVIEAATKKVNQRLAGILKAPRLEEIRRERYWNPYGRCDPPTCDWDDLFIPGEYAIPCEAPNGGIIFEHNVPCSASKKVEQLNRERTVNFVLYLGAERASPQHVDYCVGGAADDDELEAYSTICQIAQNTRRPTHGYLGVCVGASALHGDKAERMILHEVLHLLSHSNIVGMGSPTLGCPFVGNRVRSFLQCEGKTYKAVQQLWHQKDGTVIERTRLLMITPSVVEAARRHFGCDTLEGAEIEGVPVTKEESEELGGTVQPGTLIPQSHWSRNLFPDEILMPSSCGHMRLSALTLGLLKDLDWYDVDMNAAEEMVATKPEPGQGCRIAETNYSEIVARARALQQSIKHHDPNAELTGNIGPYCDLYEGTKRLVASMCYNDREPQSCTEIKNPWCGVLSRPDYYDSFACGRSRLIARNYNPALGASAGPGTTCLTIQPTRIGDLHPGAMGMCVEYDCHFDTKEVKLIWKPGGAECTIICPESESKKLWTASVADAEECTKVVQSIFIVVICPNYGALCQQDSAIDPDKTGSGAVTLKSGWMGVGSILFAMITMTVTG